MKKTIAAVILASLITSISPAYSAGQPLNSKQNQRSCTYIKTYYSGKILKDWNEGLATDNELVAELNNNIKILTTRSVVTNGAILTQVKSLIVADKKLKVSIVNVDVDGFMSSMTLKISSVKKLDQLCKSIGK